MRYRILLLLLLLGVPTAAPAQINIGINISLFPELVRVPDYPVYYAPRQNVNYFFYDGMYWVYQNDDWYSSDWYNGPWWRTAPEYVPVYVLRVPVRYYRQPPAYFRGWRQDAPPRWGEHWGRDWEQRRSGWDKWDRRAAPKPAPLPAYQRNYSGNKYPKVEEQHKLHDQKYRYQPKDALVREHVQQTRGNPAPAERESQDSRRRDSGKDARERDQRPEPARQPARQPEPAVQPSARERQPEPQRKDSGPDARERTQRPDQTRPSAQQPEPAVRQQRPQPQPTTPREQSPRSQGSESGSQDKGAARERGGESNRGHDKGPEKGREKGEERGRESGK